MSNADAQAKAAAAFAALSSEARASAGRLQGPRLRALYGLRLAEEAGLGRVALDVLSAGLDAIGIALSPLQLRNTLSPAAGRGLVSRRRAGKTTEFGLTQDGATTLEREAGGNIQVVEVVGGRPFTARSDISAILRTQRGLVRLTDPYYGVRMAHLLAETTGATQVRVLTAQCGGGEDPLVAEAALRDLMKEIPKIEIRVSAHPSAIAHDRYVVSDDELVLIGHGLKDIGSRDSFVIRLPRTLLGGVVAAIETRFDQMWSNTRLL